MPVGSDIPGCVVSQQSSEKCLYLFLDEGGNMDFSTKGTRYFTLSAVTLSRLFLLDALLSDLKFDLIEFGLDIQRFHAAEDRQAVRDRVFRVISRHLDQIRIDSVVIEKRKTGPSLRGVEHFYPRMLGYLLRYMLCRVEIGSYREVIVITDTLPVASKRRAIEKGIKLILSSMLPKQQNYRILHHTSYSCAGLQIADYCNWAVFRKWESGDERSYEIIRRALKSEFDIFQRGVREYY